jgi:hypothetical protein
MVKKIFNMRTTEVVALLTELAGAIEKYACVVDGELVLPQRFGKAVLEMLKDYNPKYYKQLKNEKEAV